MSHSDDVKAFQSFSDRFKTKTAQVVRIRKRISDRRDQLLKSAKNDPKVLFSKEFAKEIGILTAKERSIIIICEKGLIDARHHLRRLAIDLKEEERKSKTKVGAVKALNSMQALLTYLEKRLRKIDKRLKNEEHYVATRDKSSLIRFLKALKSELDDDAKLAAELLESKENVDRLENNLRYHLKQAGIKTAAVGGLIASPVLAIPAYLLDRLILDPIGQVITNIFTILFLTEKGTIGRYTTKDENGKWVVETERYLRSVKVVVRDLIKILKNEDAPTFKKNDLFEEVKF